jgi:arylsulfatase A-like enzyme
MIPHPRFRGTSDCGWRGDVIHQLDWTIGEVLEALDRRGLTKDTLVIFTSDNGGGIKDAYDDGTNHLQPRQPPNGLLRGRKGQLYEGGHRVPFIARWPARIPAGTTSDALFAHVDMIATLAVLTGQKIPAGGAPDSVNVLSALCGEKGAAGRDELVLQDNKGANLALRSGAWKLIAPVNAPPQLFDLARDPQEENDLAPAELERVKAMLARLAQLRGAGATENVRVKKTKKR